MVVWNKENVRFRTPIAHGIQQIIEKDYLSLFRTS